MEHALSSFQIRTLALGVALALACAPVLGAQRAVSGGMVSYVVEARAPIRDVARAPKYSGFQDHCTFDPSAIPPRRNLALNSRVFSKVCAPAGHVSPEVSP